MPNAVAKLLLVISNLLAPSVITLHKMNTILRALEPAYRSIRSGGSSLAKAHRLHSFHIKAYFTNRARSSNDGKVARYFIY